MSTEKTNVARSLVGTVVSDKMQKTRTVLVERQIQHAVYGKYLRRSTKLHVHDEDNQSQMGDVVRISESRPISKTKAWALVEVITKAS